MAAGEHARQQDAVVVAARLVAEHDDLETAAAADHLLHQSRAGHPVAHDDQPSARAHDPASTATAQILNSGISLVGSRAAFVRRFAEPWPPQWNGTNTVSSRMDAVTFKRTDAEARRVVSTTASPSASRWRRAVAGCI